MGTVGGVRVPLSEVKLLDLRKTNCCESTFTKDVFTNQERKLGDRRRSDTIAVLTTNHADSGLAGLLFDPVSTACENKVFGFRGEHGRKAET